MSTYINPLFKPDYALPFEEYKEDRELEILLQKLVSLRQKDTRNIKTSEFREIFDSCRLHCQKYFFRLGYRLLAFAAFSGINEWVDFPGEAGTALLYALHDKGAELDLIDTLLIATLDERSKSIEAVVKKIERIRQFNLGPSPQQSHWQPDKPSEDWIQFNHGGGFQSIHHFFVLQDWSGYESDSLIDGVWVTPMGTGYEKRDLFYACRKPALHFDTPCVLTGEIQRKYLTECPNSYEAKIPPENVKYVRNLSIKPHPETVTHAVFPLVDYVKLEGKIHPLYIEKFYSLNTTHSSSPVKND